MTRNRHAAQTITAIIAVMTIMATAALPLSAEKPVKDSGKKVEAPRTPQVEVTRTESPGNSSDKETQSTTREKTSLLSLFLKGGLFMWPILLCAAIATGISIERFIFYRRSKMNAPERVNELIQTIRSNDLSSLEKLSENSETGISRVVLKGLDLKGQPHDQIDRALSSTGTLEVANSEKGLNILSALGNIAPMIGFLGTVSGMINAFSSIASADQVSPRLVAGGIEEALLTTAFGLVTAIPILAVYNYFVHRVDLFVLDMERVSAELLGKLTKTGRGGKK
ncbi:MAG: MotA/TolQ/ExbB proton channel family protein [Spirochaetes bacterium]|nr:MotA/TolQ/ExbB proton channel family protein [Spirochaetota bacterium]